MGFLLLFLFPCYGIKPWTHTYRVSLDHALESKAESYVFEKKGVRPFTQLIFSWNSDRPEQGYFCYKVQVRNAKTKKWLSWHDALWWGRGVQQSFFSKAQDGSRYVHVRLELDKGVLADGFRLKIVPEAGATLNALAGVAVCVSRQEFFEGENPAVYSRYPSIIINGIPRISQKAVNHIDAHRICSPTSLCMLTSYMTGFELDPITFATHVYDDLLKIYGNWLFNIAYAFEVAHHKADFYVTRLHSFDSLYEKLEKKIPVVVSVRGEIKNAPQKSYPFGHLLIVVGYNGKKKSVICHDPAALSDKETLKQYALKDFLPAWEKSHRLAYIAERRHTQKKKRA